MFCESCGAQVEGVFCSKCGARAGQPASPSAPTPQYVQPLAPAAKSGSGLKILFVVLGVLGVLGVLAIGGTLYAVHKVKQVAANNGIDLNSLAETHHGPARQLDACELLTKEDLSRILNLDVDRAEGSGPSTDSTCRYFSSGAQQRARDEAEAARKKLEQEKSAGNSNADPSAVANDVGNMMRGIAGSAAAAGDANGAFLTITVSSQNARAAMTGFKLGMGISGAVVMQGGDKKNKAAMTENIQGVGDEAISGPLLSVFMFRKGDVSAQLDSRLCPGGRDAQIAIAKNILAKL